MKAFKRSREAREGLETFSNLPLAHVTCRNFEFDRAMVQDPGQTFALPTTSLTMGIVALLIAHDVQLRRRVSSSDESNLEARSFYGKREKGRNLNNNGQLLLLTRYRGKGEREIVRFSSPSIE